MTGRGRARVAVVGLQAAGEGSVPGIVYRQAALLTRRFETLLIAGSAPVAGWGGRTVLVPNPAYVSMRRYGHVVREWVASKALVSKLLEIHRVEPIDVAILHSHTLAALGGARLAAVGVRTVLVAHADIRKRPAGAYDPRLTRLYRWSNPRGYRRVDRVVALSREFAAVAAGDVRDPSSVRVIPCPVRGPWPAIQSHRLWNPEAGPLRVGFAGRLAVEKGLPDLLMAATALRGRGLDLRLLLAGDGPLRREIEGLVRQLGLGGSVELLGWISGNELTAFCESIDLLCLPSISENQGVAAQEALLAGVPVVATRVGGLADSIRPGLDGELCEPADASALAAALERAVETLKSSGYRVPDPAWMEPFSPEGHLRAVSDLIEELMA